LTGPNGTRSESGSSSRSAWLAPAPATWSSVIGFHGCSCVGHAIATGFRRARNVEQAATTTFRCLQLGNTELTFPPEWFDKLATV
jgi:ribulose-5-phosphate 4-epimerase/fuculose-1-phosphate aldolase